MLGAKCSVTNVLQLGNKKRIAVRNPLIIRVEKMGVEPTTS
jgi:hypothetical protein